MSLKTNHLKTCFLVLLIGLSAEARDYIYHNSETTGLYEIEVQNKTRTSQPIWILFYEDEYIEEANFDIPAGSTQKISLDGLKKPNWNFSVLSKSPLVKPVQTTSLWESSPSSRYEMKIKNFREFTLNTFNLYPEKQKVWLTYLNANSEVISETEFTTASFRKNLSRTEKVPAGATYLNIEAESPLVLTSSENFKPVIDTNRPAPSSFKYFLVQGGTDGTNFVAPIDDPKLIQKAREEIINFQGYIVFADIELNKTQANRNFASSEKSYWSWSIKKVTTMSQIGADWCQAYPEMIERMLHGILRQGSVCFRGQRIIRELKPSEVQSGQLNK